MRVEKNIIFARVANYSENVGAAFECMLLKRISIERANFLP